MARKTTGMRVPEELRIEIKDIADKNGISMIEAARMMVRMKKQLSNEKKKFFREMKF